jgi:hypothetical protein
MRFVAIAATLAGALSLGACSFLNPSGSAATRWANLEKSRAAKADPAASGQQVCRSIKPTGSNVPQRVCSTQAEWEAVDAQALENAEDFSRDIRAGASAPGRGQR